MTQAFSNQKSEMLFERAQRVIPGGVNSPVRAFRNLGMSPPFIREGRGAMLRDEDGNTYIDLVCSWGALIFGHAHPPVVEAICEAAKSGTSFGAPTQREVLLAELICANVPSVERIRLVNSGTEAVMSAIRVARGYTRRDKIIKFDGCYHGHCDSMLLQAGSGALSAGIPDSDGVPTDFTCHTLGCVYNDLDSVAAAFANHPDQIAAVIVEPVAANMGVIPPNPGFLQGLRSLCDANCALLIFDEVITGFRLAFGGAQEYFGVEADLVTYGKIIGGGLPVGAYGGRKEVMQCVAPLGGVYQAGTLSGNPLATSAGLATLLELQANPSIYENIEEKAKTLEKMASELALQYDIPMHINRVASLQTCFFSTDPVLDYTTAKEADIGRFRAFFLNMLKQGIYLAPSQFEALFISHALTQEHLETIQGALEKTFQTLKNKT